MSTGWGSWFGESIPKNLFTCEFPVIAIKGLAKVQEPVLIPEESVVCFGVLPVFWVPACKSPVNDGDHTAIPHHDVPWCQVSMGETCSVRGAVRVGDVLTEQRSILHDKMRPCKRLEVTDTEWTEEAKADADVICRILEGRANKVLHRWCNARRVDMYRPMSSKMAFFSVGVG